ncbi:DUF202 domain-containing protein [Microbacterium halotolerans]|uniref:DUF202 domain-containing protein n=1 Tax=Microbacterium halotolerans TaxID=246613 RepID=UPI000E6AAB41|nr:DUF202 domain-containing protein [Microbacterium halotolerans]
MSVPYDPGLQPERTLLSWRRTCLSFAVGSVILARYTVEAFGVFGVLMGLAAAGLAVAAYFSAAYEYRRVHDSLHTYGHTGGDGKPMLLATLAVLAIGVAVAFFLVIAMVNL